MVVLMSNLKSIIESLDKHGISDLKDFGGITGSEEDTYGATYTEFVSILIKAVQELSDKIKRLEEEK